MAVDQESEAIEFGRRKAKQLRIDNIEWVNATAEDVALEGTFSLVAIGNAFHRLNRAVVANRVVPHLVDRGCVALFWSDSPWRGDRPWQRAPADTSIGYSTIERWSVESLVGFVYSTSFLNRTAPAHRADAFENDLRDQLLACCPDDVFDQEMTFAVELARRR